MTTLKIRRVLASIVISGVAGASLFAPAASAKTITGNVGDISFDTISKTCPDEVTLEIQKQKHKPFQNTDPADIPAGVISGLTFEALLIKDVDITTAEGWATANSLTEKQAEDRGFTQRFTAVTDVNGIARFDGTLPVGLYLVREITPDNPHKDHRTSVPFLITLPVGNTNGDAWQCDVKIKTKEKPEPTPTPTTTPPTTKPPTTQPPVPPETTTPVPPAPVTTPSVPNKPKSVLASTGANVGWIVGVAVLLIAAGAFLVSRKRRHQQ